MPEFGNFNARAALRVALVSFIVMLSAIGMGQEMLRSRAFAASPTMAREPLWLVTSGFEHRIEVEIAETPEQSAIGLMFRTDLPEGQGMLFPSAAPREAAMWMRNTFIPLDMVFIRADGIVHRIEAMTEPLSERIIESKGPVLAVLELKGGAAARLGLKPGDKVRHRVFGTAK